MSIQRDPIFSTEVELEDYLRSDYLSDSENLPEAEVPVPDRLLSRSKYQILLAKLKLSQKIGILIWLNRNNLLSLGGRERLLYLQSKASFEALESGLKFAQRLTKDGKLVSDFKHQMRELNRRPQSKRFRRNQVRRIGVGYRDKGTLPEAGSRARKESDLMAVTFVQDIPGELTDFLKQIVPQAFTKDGEWIDLDQVLQELKLLEVSWLD